MRRRRGKGGEEEGGRVGGLLEMKEMLKRVIQGRERCEEERCGLMGEREESERDREREGTE